MMKKAVLAIMFACAALPTTAGPIENALAKLEPEERSHQACIIKGLDAVRRDARLSKADRMKTSIFAPAVLSGTLLTAKGGAVRSGTGWYALSFTCKLTDDFMRATSFTFVVGNAIPKQSWDKYGLWN